ncbi:hypothetical protein LshimejAT787_0802310 [Lyophyllum shimeji]|uniref:Uncharacterized protein n=1 Tax=Lyophyllum shimeji TaxID=47721 RepID=A0A9P3UQN2_LYOSH|nr:hypothetical protein LshimejAT787_0802310 [Lyophyllum shimeji]
MPVALHARASHSHTSFTAVLKHPLVLARLLGCLDWPDFHAVLDTSRDARDLFSDNSLRDVILSRFVPGFESCRDPSVNLDQLVPVDIYHLHLFMVSQNFPVHLYPTYALRTLFALEGINTEPLASLTQAHSRFTLLLQAMVHASPNFTIPPEQPHAHLFEKLSPTLPELTSPAPLTYQASSAPCSLHASSQPSSRPHRKLKSPGGSARRSWFFESRTPSPPPPVAEPRALRVYSSSWRRSWRGSSSHRHTSLYSSDSDNELAPPLRRYVKSTPTSTSNSRSSLSRSPTPTPPTSTSSSSPPPSRARFPTTPPPTPSPYDFVHAASPTRAPVLRVYIPCSSPAPNPQTIMRCEEQLVIAELWQHLSVGDIVANLGHVPLPDDPPEKPSKDDTPSSSTSTSIKRRRSLRGSSSTSQRAPAPAPPAANWLIFNGTFLVPFPATPAAPVPVPDALALPSPFYYTHVLPRLANPVFALRRMPRFSAPSPHAGYNNTNNGSNGSVMTSHPALSGPDDIAMRLVHLPAKVPTAHGNGAALVRRYKWLTRVYVHASPPLRGEPEPELGAGWQGEWVLEGDGTKEGREALADWLVGRARSATGEAKTRGEWEWEWELVRERCEKGRIWLKLVNVQRCVDGDSETVVSEGLV